MEEDFLIDAKKNNKNELTLDDLVDSGKYPVDLIYFIKRRDFDKTFLYIDESSRKDRAYMEPLLYAVKHDLGTYAIFKYCPESIQKDETIAKSVIQREPQLLVDTPLSRDIEFIFKNAKYSPQIINYIDKSILEDDYIVCSLCYISNGVAKEVLRNTRIDIAKAMETEYRNANNVGDTEQTTLANDRDFIKTAIQEKGANILKYASEEVKNDYEFLKEQTFKDRKIIDFAIENASELGNDGIDGIRKASVKMTTDELWNAIKSDDPNFVKFVEKMGKREWDEDTKAKIYAAYLSSRFTNATPEQLKAAVEMSVKNSLLNMERIKKDLDENGEMKLSSQNMIILTSPAIYTNLLLKLETQGEHIDENLQQKLNQYLEFYKEYQQRYSEYKDKNAELTLKMIKEGKSEAEVFEQNQDINAVPLAATKVLRSDNPSPELIIGLMKCSFFEMDQIKKDVDENDKVLFDRIKKQGLISNRLMIRFKNMLDKQGVELDEETLNKMNEYLEFYEGYNNLIDRRVKENEAWSKGEESTPKQNTSTLIISYNNMLNSALRSMETVKKTINENGIYDISFAMLQSLPLPVHIHNIKRQLEEQSILLSPEMEIKYNQYMEFYMDYKKQYDQFIRKSIPIDSIESIVSDQKISDIRTGEQRLVENLQEAEKEKKEDQPTINKSSEQENGMNIYIQQEDNSSKDDSR